MIPCPRCQLRPATRQVIDPFGNPVAVCDQCAAQQQIFGTLSKMLLPALLQPSLPALTACPSCHMNWQRVNQTSQLGCPRCYDHFRVPLEETLARLHGNTHHGGLRPPGPPAPAPNAAEQLRLELEQAVAEERFEDAARLRDQLRALED